MYDSSSSKHAYVPEAVNQTANKTPSPSAGAVRRSQSVGNVTTARDDNEPTPRMRKARSETLFADDCLDQDQVIA